MKRIVSSPQRSTTRALLLLVAVWGTACSETNSSIAAGDVARQLPQSLKEWPNSVIRPRYSPDGTHIAFASGHEGSLDLFVVDARSGAVERLTESNSNDTRPAWSPDGMELVFQSDREGSVDLWVYTLATGAVRRITTMESTEGMPDWSLRGDWVTYLSDAEGSWDIWVIRPDGTGARRVTDHEGNEYHPRFSPDGNQIVFYPTWSGWTDLYTVDVGDGRIHEILSSEFEDFRPAWSPDGSTIVFASDRSEPTGLWAVPASGGQPEPILEPTNRIDYPDWAPDGTSVLLLEETHYSHLFSIDLVTSTTRRITSDERIEVDRNPAVSPNGSVIAYETTRFGNEGNVSLWDRATATEQRVSSGRINDGGPRFSARGDRLVFTSSGGDQGSAEAVVLDLANGSSETWTSRGNVNFPAFCGDEAIVFGWAEVAYTTPLQLWRKTRQGVAERIGEHETEVSGIDCVADGSTAVVSLYSRSGGGDPSTRLVRIDLASGGVTVLTSDVTAHLHPRISPDGSQVAFVAARDGGVAAFVVPLEGGDPTEVIAAERNVGSLDWADSNSLVYSEVTRRDAARLVPVNRR